MNHSLHSGFWRWTRHIRHRPRLSSAAAVFIVLFFAFTFVFSIPRALLLSFNCGALIYLAAISVLMSRATHQSMAARAKVQNEGKWGVLGFSLILSGVVLVALYLELHGGKVSSIWDLLLASSSLLLSWLFLASVFATQYAHSFYLETDPGHLGLVFPGTDKPDYWDFMYFSVVLSMTFQVSDVQITSHVIRKISLLHSIVAFFFNVIIIAITVNVVAGAL